MDIQFLEIGSQKVAHIVSPEILIQNTQDALDLMATADSRYIILHDYNFEKDFFDLSNRKLGEILQKFTNYFVKLAVLGDFSTYTSKSLRDYIYESNKNGDYLFVATVNEVKKIWSRMEE